MSYPWLQQALLQVVRAYHNGKLPHALLFHGVAGLGKSDLIKEITALLLCEQPQIGLTDEEMASNHRACGHCRSCTLLASQTHPDLQVIDAAEEVIGIERIREVISWMQHCSQRQQGKVVLFPAIERMTLSASNALLKVLEEPPANVYFLLTTNRLANLLPTIVSRCQLIRVEALSLQRGQQYLQQLGFSPSDTSTALTLTAGSVLQAKSLLENNGLENIGLLLAQFNGWLNGTELTETLVSKLTDQLGLFEVIIADLLKCQSGVSPRYLCLQSVVDSLYKVSRMLSSDALYQLQKQLVGLEYAVQQSSGLNIGLQLSALLVPLKYSTTA